MILVDTSVWVDFLNNANAPTTQALRQLIAMGADLCLADLILVEILQGIRDDRIVHETREYLFDFPIVRASSLETYLSAVEIWRVCAKKGHRLRSTLDTLIAAIAMEHRLEVFHHDRDFDQMAQCVPLKVWKPA